MQKPIQTYPILKETIEINGETYNIMQLDKNTLRRVKVEKPLSSVTVSPSKEPAVVEVKKTPLRAPRVSKKRGKR